MYLTRAAGIETYIYCDLHHFPEMYLTRVAGIETSIICSNTFILK